MLWLESLKAYSSCGLDWKVRCPAVHATSQIHGGSKSHHECPEADRFCDGIHAVIEPFFKRLFHHLWNTLVSVKEEVEGEVACHGEYGSTRHSSTREISGMEASQERAPRLYRYLKRLQLAGWADFARWSNLLRYP